VNVLDTTLQLCVVYEIASRVFKPLDVWASDVRGNYAWLLALSLCVALGLTWLASPPAQTWMQAIATKGNLFAAALQSELFVAMMALSISARLPWKTHVAKIAQGLGAYSLLGVLIETGHSYFGVGRELPAFLILSHVRMAAYLVCVNYWMINLARDERPARRMTAEMREKMFTLQALVEYDLQDLRSRKKL
jgi:type IV secretory pathway VirB2 component (pilin)